MYETSLGWRVISLSTPDWRVTSILQNLYTVHLFLDPLPQYSVRQKKLAIAIPRLSDGNI
jgi:hypothetical protein